MHIYKLYKDLQKEKIEYNFSISLCNEGKECNNSRIIFGSFN